MLRKSNTTESRGSDRDLQQLAERTSTSVDLQEISMYVLLRVYCCQEIKTLNPLYGH